MPNPKIEQTMTDKEIRMNKLRKLLEIVDESLTMKDFVRNFKIIVKFIKAEFGRMNAGIAVLSERLKTDAKSSLSKIEQRANSYLDAEIKRITKAADDKLATIKDGKDGYTPIKGVDYFDAKDADEKQIATRASKLALKALKGTKLRMSVIKGLKDQIKAIKKQLRELKKRKPIYIGGGSSGGGHIMKVYDLSASLNGVLKTFSLPAFWRVISVHSSSFPNAFRPTTDYTTDASAMTITFTSEITASSTLQAGQTIIVTYSE